MPKDPRGPNLFSGNKLNLEENTFRDSKKLVEKSIQEGAREGHGLLDYMYRCMQSGKNLV